MKYKELLPTLILGLGLVFNSECPVAIVGGTAGAVNYVAGELKSTEEVYLDKAWTATQEAIDDLELIVTSKEKDSFDGKLIASGAAGKEIKARLKKKSEELTEIRIRVGTYGDQSLSRQILETIKERF